MSARRNFGPPRVSRAQIAEQHLTWLQALPGDGPFLTVPVLTDALPLGLEPVTTQRAAEFKHSYNTYRTASLESRDAARDEFIATVTTDILDWGNHYDSSPETTARFEYTANAFGVTTIPAFALWPCPEDETEQDTSPSLLGFVWPHNTTLTRRLMDGWATNPIDRVASTLRHHNIPLGIVTNGRWWGIVWAPRGTATGYVLFDTHAMLDDRQLLDAFTTILTRRRHLAVDANETLLALLQRALQSQEDLTQNLSIQVRRAVEMLVDSVSRADQESGGAALAGVDADHVYEGAVTVVMRLVFMLAAEERLLLPGDDAFYAANYGIAGLADRLIEQANIVGEEVLARQGDAFPQVLAATRVVHDGVRHQTLNIKGYGGSVFDPHKYPWLEGAQAEGPGKPIHVDDRTMHHILKGLTRWEGRRLAYRTLDVEQIGYVYEGLLDHTAVLADTVYLGLRGDKEPEVTLDELEAQAGRGEANLRKWLKEATGFKLQAIRKAFEVGAPESETMRRLVSACDGDLAIAERIKPYLQLVRIDERTNDPIVLLPGIWFVTASSARSDAGSYYTPRSLAEDVVKCTLDALVYDPGPLRSLNEDEWRIVSPDVITALNVADIAMGSGAFLVAADRYLADRLVESLVVHAPTEWDDPATRDLARLVLAEGQPDDSNQIDTEADEATVAARRLVATRCLYGVDINPTAVEMAKLSLWLATAAKDQPFGFLDHRLAAGDSILGLTSIGQLENVHPDPAVGSRIHASSLFDKTAAVRAALEQAVGKRKAIEAIRVQDLRDVEQQTALLVDANRELSDLSLIADAITAEAFSAAQVKNKTLDSRMLTLGAEGGALLDAGTSPEARERIRADFLASVDRMKDAAPEGGFERNPTQWVVRFPEVFLGSGQGGFDAIVGNPPFLGGSKISGSLGTDYRENLVYEVAEMRTGNADLVAYFFLRAAALTNRTFGLLATNSIAQGASRVIGLDFLVENGLSIVRAVRSEKWPSKSASIEYSMVVLARGVGAEDIRVLDGQVVPGVNTSLRRTSRSSGAAMRLQANSGIGFEGSKLTGIGFTMTPSQAQEMIEADPRNAEVLFPYLSGSDLNESSTQDASRSVVNFFDWDEGRASEYPRPFEHVLQNVKPERETNNRPIRRDNWWKYGEQSKGLYSALARLDFAIAITRHSSTVQPARVRAKQVFSDAMTVFASDSPALLALLSSAVHGEWARTWASTIGSGIRYTPSGVFETFPFPIDVERLATLGERLEEERRFAMVTREIGLTDLYGIVNDSSVDSAEIQSLRACHEDIDCLLLELYAWGDLDPKHGFFETEQGIRFTIEPTVTVEVLDRLLELNHGRYAEEVARGLHGKQANKGNRTAKGKGVEGDATLFG